MTKTSGVPNPVYGNFDGTASDRARTSGSAMNEREQGNGSRVFGVMSLSVPGDHGVPGDVGVGFASPDQGR